jgi:hypothetical protein
MGDVLNLPSPRPRAAAAPAEGGAQILFFTGVRYERMRDAPPDGRHDGAGGAPPPGRRRGAARPPAR